MKNLKVREIEKGNIVFDNGYILTSDHDQDCCESHYLSLSDLTIEDFEGLEFDLTTDDFFKRIEGYGIELLPIKGYSIRIPGYGYNNGYYSSNLDLSIYDNNNKLIKKYNISECQVITD